VYAFNIAQRVAGGRILHHCLEDEPFLGCSAALRVPFSCSWFYGVGSLFVPFPFHFIGISFVSCYLSTVLRVTCAENNGWRAGLFGTRMVAAPLLLPLLYWRLAATTPLRKSLQRSSTALRAPSPFTHTGLWRISVYLSLQARLSGQWVFCWFLCAVFGSPGCLRWTNSAYASFAVGADLLSHI
jgi:hypothetical protein